ncbi:MAG TPA: hypothetical protein VIT45_01975 [Allosphingosinicella sp.]
MPGFIRSCLAAAALAFSGGASAQQPAQDADGAEIVVTGNAEEVERQIKDFVGALTQAPPRSQLSRFESSICPGVAGLPPGQKESVIARMRRVGEAAGLRVGKPGCIPNVMLMVASDKRAFIEALKRKHPYFFDSMPSDELRRLVSEPGPAAAWQIDGPPLSADGTAMATGGGPGAEFYVNRTTRKGSLITASARPQFQAAAVVVEQKALEGLTTIQLADYAAMRAFARTDPARLPETSPPTILKVLEAPMGSEVPLTLTAWDLSFLKGLYAATDNLYAASQRSEIRRQIEEDLAGEGKPEK